MSRFALQCGLRPFMGSCHPLPCSGEVLSRVQRYSTMNMATLRAPCRGLIVQREKPRILRSFEHREPVLPNAPGIAPRGQIRFMGRLMKIAGRKAAGDQKKAKLYSKLAKAIQAASRACSGDVSDIRLASEIQKAKAANLPRDVIENAVKRGAEGKDGASMEQVVYEGIVGPAAFMVETLTDNRKRTAPVIRHAFSKFGGSLAASGQVAWMFERVGLVEVDLAASKCALGVEDIGEEELFEMVDMLRHGIWQPHYVRSIAEISSRVTAKIEAGAEDLELDANTAQVICDPIALGKVRQALIKGGYEISTCQNMLIAKDVVQVDDAAMKNLLKIYNLLEDDDDVQNIFHNVDGLENRLDE